MTLFVKLNSCGNVPEELVTVFRFKFVVSCKLTFWDLTNLEAQVS